MRWGATTAGPRDRGSVIVETAVIMPFLALMMVGISEYALALRASNHLEKLSRNAIVELVRAPEDPLADYHVLETVREAAKSAGGEIRWVMVFKAPPGSTQPPSPCVTTAESLTSGVSGVGSTCNIYSGAFVAVAAPSDFAQDECAQGAGRWLCPGSRLATFGANQRIGVAVRWAHPWKTKLLPGSGLASTDVSMSPLAVQAQP